MPFEAFNIFYVSKMVLRVFKSTEFHKKSAKEQNAPSKCYSEIYMFFVFF
jgi:hypothetical protein